MRAVNLTFSSWEFPNGQGVENALTMPVQGRLSDGTPVAGGLTTQKWEWTPGVYPASFSLDDDDNSAVERITAVGDFVVTKWENNHLRGHFFGEGFRYGSAVGMKSDIWELLVYFEVSAYVTAPFNSKNPLNNLKSCAE
jgi:hypothetical protein